MNVSGLTEAQYSAIGKIAVESAYLESDLDLCLGLVSRLSPEEFKIMVGSAMLGKKLELLEGLALLKLKSDERKREFKAIISDLKHWNEERSAAIHGLWRPKNRAILEQLGINPLLPDGEAEAVHKGGKKILSAAQLEIIAAKLGEGRTKLWAISLGYLISRNKLHKLEELIEQLQKPSTPAAE